MKLGILADSHDHVRNIEKALAVFRERGVEGIVHAGDVVAPFAAKALKGFAGPLHAVFGNNDGERAGLASILDITPPPRELRLGGRVVIVAHQLGEIPEWMKRSADVVVTGHTHKVLIEHGKGEHGKSERGKSEDGKSGGGKTPVWINPGESGGWLEGRATCVGLDLESMKAELCQIGEP